MIEKFRNTGVRLQKSTHPQSKHFGVHITCRQLCGRVNVGITVSCPTFLLEIKGLNILPKEKKNARFLATSWIKRWKTWMIVAASKIVDPRADGEFWISSNYPLRHKTTFHYAERKAELLGNSARQHLRF